MKAYRVYDRECYTNYMIIVFAESRSKAVSRALGTDEFPYFDWQFTELCAKREPKLDKYYRGEWRMDWDNNDDRIAMVKECGYYCDEDSFCIEDCEKCAAKEYCSQYGRVF